MPSSSADPKPRRGSTRRPVAAERLLVSLQPRHAHGERLHVPTFGLHFSRTSPLKTISVRFVSCVPVLLEDLLFYFYTQFLRPALDISKVSFISLFAKGAVICDYPFSSGFLSSPPHFFVPNFFNILCNHPPFTYAWAPPRLHSLPLFCFLFHLFFPAPSSPLFFPRSGASSIMEFLPSSSEAPVLSHLILLHFSLTGFFFFTLRNTWGLFLF